MFAKLRHLFMNNHGINLVLSCTYESLSFADFKFKKNKSKNESLNLHPPFFTKFYLLFNVLFSTGFH